MFPLLYLQFLFFFPVWYLQAANETSNTLAMESYLEETDMPEFKFTPTPPPTTSEASPDDETSQNSQLTHVDIEFETSIDNSTKTPHPSGPHVAPQMNDTSASTSGFAQSPSTFSTVYLPPLFSAPAIGYYPTFPAYPAYPAYRATPTSTYPLMAMAPSSAEPTTTSGAPTVSPSNPNGYYWGPSYNPQYYYILGDEPSSSSSSPRKVLSASQPKRPFRSKLLNRLFNKEENDGFIILPVGDSIIYIRN